MRKITTAFICLFILLLSLPAASRAERKKPSMLIRTKLSKDLTYKDLVTNGMDVIAFTRDGRVDIAATEEDLEWLGSKHALTTVLERAEDALASPLDANLGDYHTYEEMIDELEDLSLLYPALTSLDTLGTSIEGRYLLSIKISDNAGIDEDEPEVFIMGCNHARELMTVEISLHTARHLLENYGLDPEVTDLVDSREIWIAPMINPDGHVYVEENHKEPWYNWWRKNRRDNGDGTFGVDLNRNYGYMWGIDNVGSSPVTSNDLYRGTAPFSEPETQAVSDFCAGRNFVLSVSYHSYGELILFPWGYTYDLCDHHELFSALGDSMNSGLGYLVTAGSGLYITNGSSDDWCYGETTAKNRIFGFTPEVNRYEEGGFCPPEELILPTCEKLLDLNLTLFRLAGDPYRIMPPQPSLMHEVTMLEPPDYMISWSGGEAGDPNCAVAWDLVEFKNITSEIDSCEGPDYPWKLDGFEVSTDRAAEGLQSYYSGSGNNMLSVMEMDIVYPVSLGDTFRCSLWYDIEEYFDWAYLDASLDQGNSWITVPGNRTTDENLSGKNRGHGITGSSGDWVEAEFYLDMIGLTDEDMILLRFSYMTDMSEVYEGIYVDLIDPVSFCESRTLLASAQPDTFFEVTSSEPGVYYYTARSIDIDGQRGLWSNIVDHTVSVTTAAAVPGAVTMLGRNYPNPFNPSTLISFAVGAEEAPGSSRARVLLELYDVTGSRVAVLEDGYFPSGRYSASWDGNNENGAPAASGVYFARLVVGTKILSRKMVLLR
ncbi:MAG: immune inhibitor A [Candidatus Krumholzibacteriota bacterium]|nr:immune inhibitor A [Candidatus Krumholzibacteriota bacterium]